MLGESVGQLTVIIAEQPLDGISDGADTTHNGQ